LFLHIRFWSGGRAAGTATARRRRPGRWQRWTRETSASSPPATPGARMGYEGVGFETGRGNLTQQWSAESIVSEYNIKHIFSHDFCISNFTLRNLTFFPELAHFPPCGSSVTMWLKYFATIPPVFERFGENSSSKYHLQLPQWCAGPAGEAVWRHWLTNIQDQGPSEVTQFRRHNPRNSELGNQVRPARTPLIAGIISEVTRGGLPGRDTQYFPPLGPKG